MKYSKYIVNILLPFLLLTVGCSQPTSYVTLARHIRHQTGKQLEKECNLIPVGTMGQMMGDIKSTGISLQYFQLLDLNEARELLVYASQVFLKNINENKKIRPYLHNYPFTINNIEIVIFIYQPNGDEPPQNNLSVVSVKKGICRYKLPSPKEYAPFPLLHEETYSKALEILNEHP